MTDDDVELSSSPCSLRDLVPVDIAAWRKEERKRLIAGRMALPDASRDEMDEVIRQNLMALIGNPAGRIVSAYWPFCAEPDLRPLLRELHDAGARIALPAIVEGQPFLFREWLPGARLTRGVRNIPYPEDGPEVVPHFCIAPVVGYDAQCYRLGYGGGFFDGTLAMIAGERGCAGVGVGYTMQRIPTIHPQPHDIPMTAIVSERGTFRAG